MYRAADFGRTQNDDYLVACHRQRSGLTGTSQARLEALISTSLALGVEDGASLPDQQQESGRNQHRSREPLEMRQCRGMPFLNGPGFQ